MKIILYTKKPDETGHCPFCIKAVDWLTEKGLSFQEHVLDRDERQVLYTMFGLEGPDATVPQIVLVDDEGMPNRIGGYRELIGSGIESLFQGV